MLITEGVEAYFTLVRGPTAQLLEDNPQIHAAFQAAIHGNAQGFEVLYRHYYPTLLRLAKARAKSAEDAEDAVQDVLLKIHAGKFAHYKIDKPQGVTAVLMRSVINAAKNKNRALRGKSDVAVGDDEGEHDPASSTGATEPLALAKGRTTKLTEPEKKVVRDAVAAALKSAKLTDQERAFIQKFIGTGDEVNDISGTGSEGLGRASAIAAEVWPEMKETTRKVHAKRVKERFLRRFCDDPALGKLIAAGRARTKASSALHSTLGAFQAACDEGVIRVGSTLGLIEDREADADKVYEKVIGWIRVSIA